MQSEDKTWKLKKFAPILGLTLLLVVYLLSQQNQLPQPTIDGLDLGASRLETDHRFHLSANCDPNGELLFYDKSSLGAAFAYTGLYSLEGDNLNFQGKPFSRGQKRASVHAQIGKPSRIEPEPVYGPQFLTEAYFQRNRLGIPVVSIGILYRSDEIEKFTLVRIFKTPEMFLKTLF